jgi:hypothetical protein
MPVTLVRDDVVGIVRGRPMLRSLSVAASRRKIVDETMLPRWNASAKGKASDRNNTHKAAGSVRPGRPVLKCSGCAEIAGDEAEGSPASMPRRSGSGAGGGNH